MKRIPRSQSALVAVVGTPLVGTLLLGVLAGCASTTSSSTSSYRDGTYSTTESYQSPGGTESVAVSVAVKSNVVTAVNVSTVASAGIGAQYQAGFESAISSVVVGKSLADLSVSTVAGASLTSSAFDSALDTIRSDAA